MPLTTTAKIGISLTENLLKAPRGVSNIVMAIPTKINMLFGQMTQKLKSLISHGRSIELSARELLEKLKSAPTPAAKTSYEKLSRDADPVFVQSEELDKAAALLEKAFNEKRKKAFDQLSSVVRAKDPSSQEMRNQLKSAEDTCNKSKAEIDTQDNKRAKVNDELTRIATSSYIALPAETKNKTEIPAAIASTVQKLTNT